MRRLHLGFSGGGDRNRRTEGVLGGKLRGQITACCRYRGEWLFMENLGNEGEEEQSVHEDGDGEVWTMKLKGLYAGEHGISEREGDYFKDLVFCLAFHISHVCRPHCLLQGAYANFYHLSHVPSAGVLVSETVLFALHFPESHFT